MVSGRVVVHADTTADRLSRAYRASVSSHAGLFSPGRLCLPGQLPLAIVPVDRDVEDFGVGHHIVPNLWKCNLLGSHVQVNLPVGVQSSSVHGRRLLYFAVVQGRWSGPATMTANNRPIFD